MSPDEYQQQALRTESKKAPISVLDESGIYDFVASARLSRVLHAGLGIGGEGGEIEDHIKRVLFYGQPLDEINIIEEIGDTLWYCALALDAVGATMEDAMKRNIAKLRARYPNKFSDERAQNRDLDAERKALEGESK